MKILRENKVMVAHFPTNVQMAGEYSKLLKQMLKDIDHQAEVADSQAMNRVYNVSTLKDDTGAYICVTAIYDLYPMQLLKAMGMVQDPKGPLSRA